jgi:hypothetical protein
MLFLALFVAIVYVIDRYMFFQNTTVTFYPTYKLAQAFSLWWSIPTGVLAVLVGYW